MADENEVGELPAEDKAYFESRGEKMPEKTPEKVEKSDEKEAKADEAEADVLDDEVQPDKPDKTVPLRALTKEREEGKKARLALQEAEKRAAILEDRWNTILALQEQPAKTEVAAPPDPDTDIFAALKYEREQRLALEGKMTEREKAEKQAAEDTQRETAVWNLWGEAARAKAAETPDFQDAVKWMSETRTKQLKALGNLNPQFKTQAGIDQQINAELKSIVIAAAQQGVRASDVVYDMAKEWGYTGPKPVEAKPDTAELEKLNKDMEAETSLSSAGGSRPGTGLDAKAIADMSPGDFEAWYTKNGPAAFKRLQTRGNA